MSKTTAFETDFLELIFNNTDIANIGDTTGVRGSSTAGSLYICLFEGDPGEAGDTSTECNYQGYARVAVARSTSGWTVTGDTATNAAAVTFGECTSGSETAAYFGIAKEDAESTDDLIFYGQLDSSLAISSGIIPEFIAGAIDVTEQ
jgi:hypothetical protein